MTSANFTKLIVAIVFLWMCYIVYSTSSASNLFEQWPVLAAIPWMKATLWDFYANVFFIYLWFLYKERSWPLRILWLILLVCLGSIATAGYILIQLFKLKPGEPLIHVITNRNNSIKK
jgi:hypothetical protein